LYFFIIRKSALIVYSLGWICGDEEMKIRGKYLRKMRYAEFKRERERKREGESEKEREKREKKEKNKREKR
jgi:hypothetical protein